MIRNFPLGIGSIVVYIQCIQFTYPSLGIYLGTLASSLAYLSLLMFWNRLMSSERAAP